MLFVTMCKKCLDSNVCPYTCAQDDTYHLILLFLFCLSLGRCSAEHVGNSGTKEPECSSDAGRRETQGTGHCYIVYTYIYYMQLYMYSL